MLQISCVMLGQQFLEMHYALIYMHNTHITINYCNLYPLIQTSWQPSLMPVCVYFHSGEQSQISWWVLGTYYSSSELSDRELAENAT